MTVIRNLLTGAALGLAALSTFAAPSAAQRLDAFLTKTQEGAGTFEQRVVTKEGEEAAPAARGSFQFKRPGHFLWRYEEPYRQLIVSNGETLWFYDEDLAQVTKNTLSGALPTSPASILFGTGRLDSGEWTLTESPAAEGLDWVTAKPREAGVFERVEIGFRDEGEAPVRMRLVDGFGQVTTLDFLSFEGKSVPASVFEWTPPEGVDVLDMGAP